MLCKLHSVYNTLHTLCDITQKVSNHYTVEGQFFAFNLEKNYTGQKKFKQAPPVVPVINIGYVIKLCSPMILLLFVSFFGRVHNPTLTGQVLAV